MKVDSESEVAQLCLTLSDPMVCSLPDSSIYGIFQARVVEWDAIAFSDISLYLSIKNTCLFLKSVVPRKYHELASSYLNQVHSQ